MKPAADAMLEALDALGGLATPDQLAAFTGYTTKTLKAMAVDIRKEGERELLSVYTMQEDGSYLFQYCDDRVLAARITKATKEISDIRRGERRREKARLERLELAEKQTDDEVFALAARTYSPDNPIRDYTSNGERDVAIAAPSPDDPRVRWSWEKVVEAGARAVAEAERRRETEDRAL